MYDFYAPPNPSWNGDLHTVVLSKIWGTFEVVGDFKGTCRGNQVALQSFLQLMNGELEKTL